MAKKYKILIASILAGSGHNSAGDLLMQVLKKNDIWEIIRFVHPSKFVDNGYNNMSNYSPIVENYLVNNSPVILMDAMTLSMINLVDECVDIINKENPDCVISTHSNLSCWFKIAQWITKKPFIVINTFLDYGEQSLANIPYNLFLKSEFDIAFSEEARDSLIKITKQDPKSIILVGHRPKEEFTATNNLTKEQAKIKLAKYFKDPILSKISDHKISILIAGGGGGIMQKTRSLLEHISKYQKKNIELIDRFQFFIICGQNQKYQQVLLKMRKTKLSWQNIIPFGWLSPKEYALVQRASDFPILYSIAPATMHELMASQTLPLIVHKVRAEHEMGNVEFVEKMGLGYFIKNDVDLLPRIFNHQFIRDQEIYRKKSDLILKKEEERLNSLSMNLERVLNQKPVSVYETFPIDFKNKVFSIASKELLTFVYYSRKLIRKVFKPGNVEEKKK